MQGQNATIGEASHLYMLQGRYKPRISTKEFEVQLKSTYEWGRQVSKRATLGTITSLHCTKVLSNFLNGIGVFIDFPKVFDSVH